jgi:hypothetical protein
VLELRPQQPELEEARLLELVLELGLKEEE